MSQLVRALRLLQSVVFLVEILHSWISDFNPYVGKEKSIPFPTTAMAPAAKRPMPEVTFTGVANRFAR